MAVTQKEIAKALKISQRTISRAINDKPDISKETREKVLETISEHGYFPNEIARSLVLKRTKMIGVIVPCVTFSFFPEIVRSIEDEAKRKGYHVVLCHSDSRHDREAEEINLLRQIKVAGLIMVPSADNEHIQHYKELKKAKIPFVFVDQYIRGLETNFVGTDDKVGAYEAVLHLISLGHRRIAYLAGPPNDTTSEDRMAGYQEALAEHNIPFQAGLVKGNAFSEVSGEQGMGGLLKMEKRPTAVFAASDLVAIGAMKAIGKEGLRIPEDITLVGFADLKMASVLSVPLTTVRQPAREIGRKAVEILFKEIEEGKSEPRRIFLKARLIIRESCGYKGRERSARRRAKKVLGKVDNPYAGGGLRKSQISNFVNSPSTGVTGSR